MVKKAITILIAFLLALLLLSCGASYHLRKAQKHLRAAQIKGATIVSDTIYQEVPIITDRFIHDTVVNRVLGDTLVINHTRYRLKMKYDTVVKREYVQVECKPDTIYREVPVEVPLTIKAPPKGIRLPWVLLIIAATLVLGFTLAQFRKR